MKRITEKLTMFALAAPVLAADNISVGAPRGFENLDKVTIPSLVSGGIQLLIVLAALVFLFILIIGGIRWILSGGDENKVKEARGQITNALIGLAIVFLAWAILKLMDSLFGTNIAVDGVSLPKLY